MKFKKGDRIRVIDNAPKAMHPGREGTIEERENINLTSIEDSRVSPYTEGMYVVLFEEDTVVEIPSRFLEKI
ncbi:MAG: hypothetical protein ACLFR2_06350 [Candidatus Kapaibacterium sp.]